MQKDLFPLTCNYVQLHDLDLSVRVQALPVFLLCSQVCFWKRLISVCEVAQEVDWDFSLLSSYSCLYIPLCFFWWLSQCVSEGIFFFHSFLVKYQCSVAYIKWQLGSENFLLNLQGYFLWISRLSKLPSASLTITVHLKKILLLCLF